MTRSNDPDLAPGQSIPSSDARPDATARTNPGVRPDVPQDLDRETSDVESIAADVPRTGDTEGAGNVDRTRISDGDA